MNVKELIKELLECDLDDEVVILLQKGIVSKIHVVHDNSVRAFSHTGVMQVAIEPFDDLQFLAEN